MLSSFFFFFFIGEDSDLLDFSLTVPVEAPAYLIDLMHDKNTEIRKVCDNTLDIIAVSQSVFL